MLRFFRSIRQRLVNEGKTSKYFRYAFGEFVLIVAGILVALQIQNWNENRKARTQEKIILAEIHEEFLYNKKEWEDTSSRYQSTLDRLNSLIEAFPLNLETLDKSTLEEMLRGIHTIRTFDKSSVSIDKLKAFSFDILSNEELRALLMDWEVRAQDYREREELALRFLEDHFSLTMEKNLPRPYRRAFEDPRVDLNFLNTLEFEALIKERRRYVGLLVNSRLNADGISKFVALMDRIIELSKPEEIKALPAP